MAKKHYVIGVRSPQEYQDLYNNLLKVSAIDDVPDRTVQCTDKTLQSAFRGTFFLEEEEAKALRKRPEVMYIHLDSSYHFVQDPFPSTPDDLRFKKKILNYRNLRPTVSGHDGYGFVNSMYGPEAGPDFPIDGKSKGFGPASGSAVNWSPRTNWGIQRITSSANRWNIDQPTVSASPSALTADIEYTLNGKGVDVIVSDDGCWFGHPEFIDKESGTSTIRDVVLDGPYYLDPDYFDADPENRLTTRWDGLVQPSQSAATDWWLSADKRSVSFSGAGESGWYQNVPPPSAYTNAAHHGTATEIPTANAAHGTPCSSLAFGKNFGLAWGANKWSIAYGYVGKSQHMDMMNIFHRWKPTNPETGRQNPTIVSTSWSSKWTGESYTGYWGFAGSATAVGTTGAFFDSNATRRPPDSTRPRFLKTFSSPSIYNRYQVNVNYNSYGNWLGIGDELANTPGFFWFSSAGNQNQMQVPFSHPFYYNYLLPGQMLDPEGATGATGVDGGVNKPYSGTSYNYVNRAGYPNQCGVPGGGEDDLVFPDNGPLSGQIITVSDDHPIFRIGALAWGYTGDNKNMELKAEFSSGGPLCDMYCAGQDVLAAAGNRTQTDGYTNYFPRADTYPGGLSGDLFSGTGCYLDYDFNGTSAATPLAAGWFACLLQTNPPFATTNVVSGGVRSSNVNPTLPARSPASMSGIMHTIQAKQWIKENIKESICADGGFYSESAPTVEDGPNSSKYSYWGFNTLGADLRILYDDSFNNRKPALEGNIDISGQGLEIEVKE